MDKNTALMTKKSWQRVLVSVRAESGAVDGANRPVTSRNLAPDVCGFGPSPWAFLRPLVRFDQCGGGLARSTLLGECSLR
jgi:hypothetical protein